MAVDLELVVRKQQSALETQQLAIELLATAVERLATKAKELEAHTEEHCETFDAHARVLTMLESLMIGGDDETPDPPDAPEA